MRYAWDDRVWSGLLFFITSAWFILALMIGEALAPGYSVHSNPVSDLGIIPETAVLFNSTVFVVGALNIIGGYLFYRHHHELWILALYVLAGIGAMGVGIFTLNSGIHGIFALISFIFFNLQAIGTATLLKGPLKPISVLLGATGLIALVLHASSDFGIANLDGPIGPGGMERMIVYPVMIFLLVLSGYLMSYARDATVRVSRPTK